MEKKSDLRVRKTYEALIRAFEELLSRKTFDDITVNELCQTALIRRPTFYSHFEDKYDFLRFYLNEIQSQIESESDEVASDNEQHFEHSWRMLMKFVDEHEDLIHKNMKAPSMTVVFDILGEHLAASTREKMAVYLAESRPELLGSADTIVSFIAGGVIQNLKRYLYGKCKDAETLSSEMVNTFRGLWRGIVVS